MSVEWRALGPVEVTVDGRLVDLGPPAQRALFGLLLSRVDQPVALDVLVEELWSGTPPPAAMASLRTYVSNLRRVLEPSRAPWSPAAVLRTRAPGYLLDSRGVEFDVHRFTRHATSGREALSCADPQQALREFDAALGLWRGQAYADMRDADWAAPEVARLAELRLSVIEARCAALLEVGAHDVAVAELELHVRAQPLREHGCELLALALYRAGRQAEALRILRATREQLAEELGIDPGAALQRLERDILTQAPALDWQPPPATPAPKTPPPPYELLAQGNQRVVSTQVHSFSQVVGREDELTALRAGFTDPHRAPRPVLRVLTGLGGVGKTTLARAYAQRYQDQYELVWWVRAEDPEAVPGEFRALLDILAPQYAEHTHDAVQSVHAVLANRTKPWLLVIDNIAEPSALRGLLPAAGTGDVLVTSRAGTWPDRRIVLSVQPLTQPHAVRLVTTLSGDPDQTTAALLAHELGCLPLALAQAGCYVAHSTLNLADYLALYQHRRAELHKEGHAPDYPTTVATTWQLAFDQLTPLARALLNLLAWYAPDIIPLDQLLTSGADHLPLAEPVNRLVRPLLVDELRRHRAVTELIAYGLLTRSGPTGSVTVHRLVQAVTADQLTACNHHEAWIITAAALLDAAYPRWHTTRDPRWPGGRVAITAWQSLQTHVRTMIEHLSFDQPVSLNLRYLLADWVGWTGDFVRARKLTAAVAQDMTRVLGPDHPHTLATRISLAYWTGEAGDVMSAQKLAAELTQDVTQALGANHRLTLLARASLARLTALSGEVERARELIDSIIAVLGPDDPETLVSRSHLAQWTGEAGDVTRARELAAAVVEDDQRVLGPDHRHTLSARANLARWTAESGDLTRARELAAALVADNERVLGPDHRHTLLARAHLVQWTGEAGDVVRARELTAALVEDDQRVLGPGHRHTLLARAQLARWTGEAGDVAGAQELATTLMADMVRTLGPDHRDTRAAQIQLAPWTDDRT